ncbi:rubredoxin [Skermanella stibiiresistens SB22]|uniref:Rubredoxin n=1 Tax=Skermanella stibiiresistens SB22 TaxID=1385369 RepID=W9H302_9PROT|nr:[NiFe]-hydrogenase assembly chaperone HybE [Skermanella stibiiresistens]EWY38118.1 rubredoxin [Skermanella stibiiresistens SB22]
MTASPGHPNGSASRSASGLFEGSFLGDLSRIPPGARLECGICWTRYDPAEGDPVSQVAAGTAFADLPADWRCPTCDAERHKFMVLDAPPGQAAAMLATSAAAPVPAETPAAALVAAYHHIAVSKMADLPVFNARLAVEAIGFHRHGDAWLGIMVTPWFMNAVLAPAIPGAWDTIRDGVKSTHALPSGAYEFVAGHIDGVGTILTCSLFSPMFEFEEQGVVRQTAEAALAALLAPEDAPEEVVTPPAEPPAPVPAATAAELSRRRLLRGGFGA